MSATKRSSLSGLVTNEPGVTPGAPDPMTLDEICECIEDNIDAIDTDPGR